MHSNKKNPYNSQIPMRLLIVLTIVVTFAVMSIFVGLFLLHVLVGVIVFILFLALCLFLGRKNTTKKTWIRRQVEKTQIRRTEKLNGIYGKLQTIECNCFYFGCDRRRGITPAIIEIIRGAVIIISNDTIEIPNAIWQNVEDMYGLICVAEYTKVKLEEKNKGASIDLITSIEDFVCKINNVIDERKLPTAKIAVEQITEFDDEHMRNRRQDNIVTMDNDVNIAHKIIAKQGYELISVFGLQCLTVVTPKELDDLRALSEALYAELDEK